MIVPKKPPRAGLEPAFPSLLNHRRDDGRRRAEALLALLHGGSLSV